jgi:hypothetical protein
MLRFAPLALVALLVPTFCGQTVSAGAATPPAIPLTTKQEAAVKLLGGYAVHLVAFTRTIDGGVEVPTASIVALRASIARWSRTNRSRFTGRLAPVATLAARSIDVLTTVDVVETKGGHPAALRYRSAAIAFDAAATAFGTLRFVQRSR